MKGFYSLLTGASLLPLGVGLNAQSFISLPSFDGPVNAMAIAGDTLYLGGSFTMVDGTTARNGLAAIDLTTYSLTSWNPGANGTVRTLALSDDGSTLYAGGNFTTIGGGGTGNTSRNYLGAVNTTTSTATSWNPDPNQAVTYMARSTGGSTAGSLYVVGDFTSLNGGTASRPTGFAGIDASGTATSFAPANGGNNIANGARGLAVSGDGNSVYLVNQSSYAWDAVGGGTTTRRGITALQASDGLVTSFNPAATEGGFGGNSFAITTSGNDLYVSGSWDTISGQDRARLAKYTSETLNSTFDTSTGGNGGLNSGTARRLVLLNGVLYVLGDFDAYNGTTRRGIAAVDAVTGALVTNWDAAGSPTSDIGHDSTLIGGFAGSAKGIFLGDQDMQDLLSQNVAGRYLAGLSAVPEPSQYAAACAGICLAAAALRRARRSPARG